MNDQYYNMKEKIEPVRRLYDIAYKAMENLGYPTNRKADSWRYRWVSTLLYGIPTPNIFAGGENFHGKFEYVSVDNMIKATNVIIEIVKLVEADNVSLKKA